jgi:hypothetical protein
MSYKEGGLDYRFQTFRVIDEDMSTEAVEDKTFTLFPEKDPYALGAIAMYAALVHEINPQLTIDLVNWIEGIIENDREVAILLSHSLDSATNPEVTKLMEKITNMIEDV